jgi:hypothetical protein
LTWLHPSNRQLAVVGGICAIADAVLTILNGVRHFAGRSVIATIYSVLDVAGFVAFILCAILWPLAAGVLVLMRRLPQPLAN